MIESAELNRRERKRQDTAERLTTISRRLTAERGLSGFTIEEVCEEADVSRRTFFNYFPTKEDAILGVDPAEDAEHFARDFLDRGSRGWGAVLDDLTELVIEHFSNAGVDQDAHRALHAAIEREPKLLLSFMGVTRQRDRQALELVAHREGVGVDDPRAQAAISLLSAIIKGSVEEYLEPTTTTAFSTIVRERLAAIRTVTAATGKAAQ